MRQGILRIADVAALMIVAVSVFAHTASCLDDITAAPTPSRTVMSPTISSMHSDTRTPSETMTSEASLSPSDITRPSYSKAMSPELSATRSPSLSGAEASTTPSESSTRSLGSLTRTNKHLTISVSKGPRTSTPTASASVSAPLRTMSETISFHSPTLSKTPSLSQSVSHDTPSDRASTTCTRTLSSNLRRSVTLSLSRDGGSTSNSFSSSLTQTPRTASPGFPSTSASPTSSKSFTGARRTASETVDRSSTLALMSPSASLTTSDTITNEMSRSLSMSEPTPSGTTSMDLTRSLRSPSLSDSLSLTTVASATLSTRMTTSVTASARGYRHRGGGQGTTNTVTLVGTMGTASLSSDHASMTPTLQPTKSRTIGDPTASTSHAASLSQTLAAASPSTTGTVTQSPSTPLASGTPSSSHLWTSTTSVSRLQQRRGASVTLSLSEEHTRSWKTTTPSATHHIRASKTTDISLSLRQQTLTKGSASLTRGAASASASETHTLPLTTTHTEHHGGRSVGMRSTVTLTVPSITKSYTATMAIVTPSESVTATHRHLFRGNVVDGLSLTMSAAPAATVTAVLDSTTVTISSPLASASRSAPSPSSTAPAASATLVTTHTADAPTKSASISTDPPSASATLPLNTLTVPLSATRPKGRRDDAASRSASVSGARVSVTVSTTVGTRTLVISLSRPSFSTTVSLRGGAWQGQGTWTSSGDTSISKPTFSLSLSGPTLSTSNALSSSATVRVVERTRTRSTVSTSRSASRSTFIASGPASATISSRVTLVIQGSLWNAVLESNREGVVAALLSILSETFHVPASDVTIEEISIGSLRLVFVVRRSVASPVSDGALSQLLRNSAVVSPLLNVYSSTTGAVSSGVTSVGVDPVVVSNVDHTGCGVGCIVGAAVGGSVAAIVIVVGLLMLIVRSRRQQNEEQRRRRAATEPLPPLAHDGAAASKASGTWPWWHLGDETVAIDDNSCIVVSHGDLERPTEQRQQRREPFAWEDDDTTSAHIFRTSSTPIVLFGDDVLASSPSHHPPARGGALPPQSPLLLRVSSSPLHVDHLLMGAQDERGAAVTDAADAFDETPDDEEVLEEPFDIAVAAAATHGDDGAGLHMSNIDEDQDLIILAEKEQQLSAATSTSVAPPPQPPQSPTAFRGGASKPGSSFESTSMLGMMDVRNTNTTATYAGTPRARYLMPHPDTSDAVHPPLPINPLHLWNTTARGGGGGSEPQRTLGGSLRFHSYNVPSATATSAEDMGAYGSGGGGLQLPSSLISPSTAHPSSGSGLTFTYSNPNMGLTPHGDDASALAAASAQHRRQSFRADGDERVVADHPSRRHAPTSFYLVNPSPSDGGGGGGGDNFGVVSPHRAAPRIGAASHSHRHTDRVIVPPTTAAVSARVLGDGRGEELQLLFPTFAMMSTTTTASGGGSGGALETSSSTTPPAVSRPIQGGDAWQW